MFPRIGAIRRLRASPWVILLLVFLLLETLIHFYSLTVPVPNREQDEVFYKGCRDPAEYTEREKAVLVMLLRNSDVGGALTSLRTVEQRFNRFFHYPVMFLNDEPWEPDVMAQLNTSVSGDAIFEIIPAKNWGFPEGMDVDAAKKSMQQQERDGVKYGGAESYHHMCRFYSG